MGLCLSRSSTDGVISPLFLCSIRKPVSSSRPALRSRRRAQDRRTDLVACFALARLHTLTAPSTTARLVRSGDDQRGARFRGAINRATTLYPVGPGPEPRCSHAHRQRSSEPADPFSPSAYESQGSTSGPRHLEPSSATVTSGRPGPKLSGAFSVLRSMRRPQNDAVRHHAFSHQPPQGNQKLARQGHDHELASTTGVLSAGSKPLCQGAVLLEHEKSPRRSRAPTGAAWHAIHHRTLARDAPGEHPRSGGFEH